MTKETILTRLAESCRDLHRATQGRREAEMTQDHVEGVWTITDVLGHIASREEVCLEHLRRYADGSPFKVEATEDYLSLNEPLAARQQDIPLDAILDELGAIRQAWVATASRLSAGQWEQRVLFPWGDEGPAAEMLDELCERELEHVQAIQQRRVDRG
jgi:hypothetical protein